MNRLDKINDRRKPSHGTLHDFRELLVRLIAAVLSGRDMVEDIIFWARTKETWLRRFLVLKNRNLSEEALLPILRALDPTQFETMSRRWVGVVVSALSADAPACRYILERNHPSKKHNPKPPSGQYIAALSHN